MGGGFSGKRASGIRRSLGLLRWTDVNLLNTEFRFGEVGKCARGGGKGDFKGLVVRPMLPDGRRNLGRTTGKGTKTTA